MKQSILFLLLLSVLSILTFSQESSTIVITENVESPEPEIPINPGADNYNTCDPNNRPEVCTLQYAPVCGYIENCEGGNCTRTFGNSCSACGNENVTGYVNGSCEDARNVCDPDDRPEICTLIYTATCAVLADCEGSDCFINAGSPCAACGTEGVAYSLPGACPGDNSDNDSDNDDRTYCQDPRRQACTKEYNPVCAHKADCTGSDCYFTAGNACTACSDESVAWHVPGECSGQDAGEGEGEYCEDDGEDDGEYCEDDGEDDGEYCEDDVEDNSDVEIRTYCEDPRPEICTMDYRPVCAHTADCEGDDCFNTAGNACGACSNPDVDYHTPGEC